MAQASTSASAKSRPAVVSIVSNACLIALKLAAGLITGSVGILSDAIHSLMDLIASVVALISVRKADAPADSTHRYGHQSLEDLSAGAQALLLLVGATFIAVEAIRRLVNGGRVQSIGIGIVVAAGAAAINLVVSTYLRRAGRRTGSPALNANAADLRTDAIVSIGVLVSLALVKVTGLHWIDSVVALLVAAAISATGVRILNDATRRLVDEALPPDELAALQEVVNDFVSEEVVGVHDVRARHVGSSHQVDLHMQFADGTSLRRAHFLSHELQDAIVARLPGTTVLIHLEPADFVRPDRFADSHPAAAVQSDETNGRQSAHADGA